MKNIRLYFALLGLCFCSSRIAAQAIDTEPPKITCWQERYVDCISTTCSGKIQAIQFVVTVTDDQTPTNQIILGIRKKCTGSGFPEGKTSLSFSVSELGLVDVELWAKDLAGNTAVCPAQVIVTHHSGNCDPGFSIYAHTPKDSTTIGGTIAMIDRNTCQNEITTYKTDLPYESFGSLSRPGDLLVVTPSKTGNPLNGVTTYDLVLISRHILGLTTLSPYQLIAADANQDGKVTTYDIVLLRQLILGIITELPNQASWRFVPYDYVFPDPANPFSPMFPERMESPRSADPAINFFQFFGVKIGDVDYSADLK